MSGKKKQNTIKPTAIGDGQGRLLWLGAIRPGRMHDATALRTEGIEDLLRRHPSVTADVNSGYQGLARDFPGQITAPPKKPKTGATPSQVTEREATRKQQSSRRICIEHAIAEPKQWRTLQRYTGRRDTSKTQLSPSAGWYPTAARAGKDHQPDPPAHHAPHSIAHHVVSHRAAWPWPNRDSHSVMCERTPDGWNPHR